MFSSFEGQTRSRPAINLGGGASSSSSSTTTTPSTSRQLAAAGAGAGASAAERAKFERQQREDARRLDRAARTVQGWWKGQQSAAITRHELRSRFDYDDGDVGSTLDNEGLSRLLHSTSILVLLSRKQSKANDAARLGRWARTVAAGKPPNIVLFQAFRLVSQQSQDRHAIARWSFLVRRMATATIQQAALQPSLPSVFLFLELVRQLLDPAKYVDAPAFRDFPVHLADHLVRARAFNCLRRHIVAFPPNSRPVPISTSPAIAVASALLNRLQGTASLSNASSQFVQELLSVQGLLTSSRLAANSLASLTNPTSQAQLPLLAILEALRSDAAMTSTVSAYRSADAAILGNVLTLLQPRLVVSSNAKTQPSSNPFSTAKDLVLALEALKGCVERAAAELRSLSQAATLNLKGKTRETAIDLDEASHQDGHGDVEMLDVTSVAQKSELPSLDPATLRQLDIVASEPFLSSIIALSTRFSATSRPALSAFLVALLYAWPAKRESIVNTLVYSNSVGAGRGLLREIWRGWVRSSSLSRVLSSSTSGSSSSSSTVSTVLNALSDKNLAADWPHFILLSELYTRCLLTLGDDEFFAASSAGSSAAASGGKGGSATTAVNSRNPLTIDEVVGLSVLLRNVAFALYWQPDALKSANGEDRVVVGTGVHVESLRKLVTGLLQMIHARDSRRKFTPQDHWIMTSQLDLQSFIESVILEDQALDADEASGAGARSERQPRLRRSGYYYDDDDTDEEGDLPRPQATVRRNLPSRRQMAKISPRLGVLNNIPFVIPFETRVSIFQQFIANDRARLGLTSHNSRGFDGRRVTAAATIRRGHVADDGFATLNGLGSQLKERLAIRFIDQYGQEEAGIDGGGLFKEFLTSLSKEAFDIDRGLWLETPAHELYPAATSYARDSFSLQWYAFLGRIMGKALYEGILVDVPFAPFFLSKWLGRASGFDDLASFDPALYSGLVQLKNYPGDVEKDLSLNFAVEDDDFGVTRTIELLPNGSNVAVTNENRISYIYRVSDYRLNKQIEKQCSAFFSGLSDLIDPKWLRMFNQVELALLVGGAETAIDVDDLRHNTVYSRGYDESHPSVQYFWKVVNEFSQEDKKALVKFATSCPRPPLLGFGQLNPKFAIGNGGTDETRLPSASTCVNLLKLPAYSSPEVLRAKLRASIHSGAGFDLS